MRGCETAFMMAPVASSLTSKLKLWVVTDDTFTTNGNVVICQVCDKKTMLYEVAIGTTHPKRSSYKKQTTAAFQKASTSDPSATKSGAKNEFF
jgi:hypothetical protein